MRELTISLPDDVYDELERRVGPANISGFIERIVRPHVVPNEDLAADYRAMAADAERERDALSWIEADRGRGHGRATYARCRGFWIRADDQP